VLRRRSDDAPKLADRAAPLIEEAAERSRVSWGTRVERLRLAWRSIFQASVSAAIAWLIATEVLGHPRPFFAPVSAIITLGITVGQRPQQNVLGGRLLAGVDRLGDLSQRGGQLAEYRLSGGLDHLDRVRRQQQCVDDQRAAAADQRIDEARAREVRGGRQGGHEHGRDRRLVDHDLPGAEEDGGAHGQQHHHGEDRGPAADQQHEHVGHPDAHRDADGKLEGAAAALPDGDPERDDRGDRREERLGVADHVGGDQVGAGRGDRRLHDRAPGDPQAVEAGAHRGPRPVGRALDQRPAPLGEPGGDFGHDAMVSWSGRRSSAHSALDG
jgi:hypothetical protein